MSGSFLSEVFAPFGEILTSPIVIDCLWRWLCAVCFAFAGFGLFATIDILCHRRYVLTSAYVDILTGPLGTFCVMVFCAWPMIVEVFQWV